jgi:hypothetical protein
MAVSCSKRFTIGGLSNLFYEHRKNSIMVSVAPHVDLGHLYISQQIPNGICDDTG